MADVTFIITFTGNDRTGIVEAVARVVAAHGGNWEESRMTRLAGRFAGLLKVTARENRADTLQAGISELDRVGLKVHVERAPEPTPPPAARRFTLELTGVDQPGIVRAIAKALVDTGLNIENLETERRAAPMSGQLLFCAQAILGASAELDLGRIRANLEAIAADLMVDVRIEEAP